MPLELGAYAQAVLDSLTVAKPVTVWEAIGDLPANVVPSGSTIEYPGVTDPSDFLRMMRLDYSEGRYTEAVKRQRALGTGRTVLHNHHTKEMLAKRANLISFLRPGEKADSLPKAIWNGARPEKWRRLHPDLPAYTILAQMHRDLSEWVHPEVRALDYGREAARLQSFHDGFIFQSSEWQMLKQIGNAVPPLLAYAAARMAKAVLAATEGKAEAVRPVQGTLQIGRPPQRAAMRRHTEALV